MQELSCEKNSSFLAFFFALVLVFSLNDFQGNFRAEADQLPKAKHIILLVPDGMGLSNVTAARTYKNGTNGDLLYLETLPHVGYQRTHSADSSATDSAAAASAWASGEKFRNGEISCHDNDQDGKCEPAPSPTILELAKAKNKATGLVATSTVTHATPAAFAAHVHTRQCEKEIARQYIQVTGVDVILGGGLGRFRSTKDNADKCGTSGDFISDAQNKGYVVTRTKEEMDRAASKGARRILGLFSATGKTPEFYRVFPEKPYPTNEPTLGQMTQAALKILENDREGFFLLVEGSQIDWANHRNDLHYQISEVLAFDEAVKVVLDWAKKEPNRTMNTLIIVAPDHETGGFVIRSPQNGLYEAGNFVDGRWTTREHTVGDALIWSQGPGSRSLGKAVDNTDLYRVMKDALM